MRYYLGRSLGWVTIFVAIYCLAMVKHYANPESFGMVKIRLLSLLGMWVTLILMFALVVTILLPAVVLVVPAFLCFGALVFKPALIQKSKGIRLYLSGCLLAFILASFLLSWSFWKWVGVYR